MKNYFLTIVLVLLVAFGLFNIFRNKKNSKQLVKQNQNEKVLLTEEKPVEQGLSLELTSPADKSVVNTPSVTVSGKTSPNVDVFVNEKELKSDSSGNFSVSYELFEGENNIFVAVNDAFGNYAEKSVTVYLETTE